MTEPNLDIIDTLHQPEPANGADRAGIALSLVCLVHCLALPLALAVVPSLGIDLASTETLVHWLLLGVAVPVALLALWLGMRRHKAWDLMAMGMVGLVLMFVGVAHVFGHSLEAPLTVAGVLLLLAAHVLNWRRCRAHGDHCHAHHQH